MKKTKLLILGLTFYISLTQLVEAASLAQTSTNTATNSATTQEEDPEVSNSIKERIQQAVEKNLGISTNNQQTGLVGKLESVTDQSMSLSINGSIQQVSVDETTLLVDEDNQEISIEDFAIDGGALVIGTLDSANLLNAEKIIAIEEIPQPSLKVTLIGNITTFSTRQGSLSISTNTSNEDFFIETDKNSQLFEGFSQEDLKLADLNESDKVLIIFETNEDDENILQVLHRIEVSPDALLEETE